MTYKKCCSGSASPTPACCLPSPGFPMKKLFCLFVLLVVAFPLFAANPMVEMKTSQGTITIELYPEKSPRTVDNFLQYVRSGFYKGTIFHRVIDGFMIQGGGF